MSTPLSKVKVTKVYVQTRARLEAEDLVAVEAPINVYVNGAHYVTLMATPTTLRELAVGHVLGEGLLGSLSELNAVKVEGNAVRLEAGGDVNVRLKVAGAPRLVPTACGSIDDYISLLDRLDRPLVKSDYALRAEEVLRMAEELNRRAEVFKATGGVHSAALYQGGVLVAFSEDIGRHNAVDKVLGIGALSGVDFQRSVMLSSGRLSADMVVKAARLGIPIAASLSAPLSSGIRAAERAGVTLVGFVRGGRMNVYAHPRRVL